MLRWIVASSLRLRFLVIASAAALMFFGIVRLRDMPVDVFPEFAPPRVEIQTEALGLSTTETESLITVPLEQALNGTPGLDILRSKSVPGLSSILLIFKPGTDLIEARQLVQERLAQVVRTLPSVATPPVMLQPLSSTSRLMKIGLSSNEMSLIDMSEVVRWKIAPRLMNVPGVANVAIWGARKKQIVAHLDSEQLQASGVTIQQVSDAAAGGLDVGLLAYLKGATIGTGGFVDTPNQRLNIQHVLPIISPEGMAQVPIEGKDLRLGEVATVEVAHPPLIGDAVINDGPGLLLIVEKFPWGNTLEVTQGVEAALKELEPALTGIEVDSTIFRPATFIETAIDNLTMSLLIGAGLLILVLIAFLYNWRVAVISLVAMPLSLVAAGLVLYWRGASINTMILAGFVIALGDIVDDAIIDIENVVRRLRQHRAEGSTTPIGRIILDASLEVRHAIVYATLIEVVAIGPVFFMEGLSGAFFRPLAFSYAIALLVSMVVALTVTPALSLLLLRNAPEKERESPLIPWFQRGYDRLLKPIVRAPRMAYGMVALIVVAGISVLPFLGQSLLPSFKERDFLMHWLTKPGTSLPEMMRITTQASVELRAIPGVRNFGAHIGRALAADEVVGIDFGENWISVDPAADYDATLASVQATVDGYPGLYRDVQTYLKERIKEVLTGTSETIVVRIFGPDLDVLHEKSAEVKAAMEGIDGIIDLHEEHIEDIPQMEIEVDLARAQRYGLTPGEVRRAAASYVNGIEVGDVFRDGKVIDIRIRGTDATRHSVSSVRNLLLDTPSGEHVRLEDVADVRVVPTPNVIKREAVSRRLDVSANVRGRDLGSVAREVEQRLQTIEFPREYHPVVLGEYAERQAAESRLFYLAIAAAVGIFFLLQASFGSWRLTTLSFLTLPSALVGGVLAAFASDGVISLGSLVGFLTVLGIVARNGIMLISHYQHLEQVEGMAFGPELIVRGAKERLAPILMTGATTGLSLIPLIVAGNIPGHEIEHPMAIVILGGLLTSTLLNLFVVPALYLRFGKGATQPALTPAGA
ncbi:MAG TPA: efflux RND transporter permease subunit [Herpetosiphonaceae bacterium]